MSKTKLVSAASLSVFCLGAVAFGQQLVIQGQGLAVETFTASGTATLVMPGTPQGSGIRFVGTATPGSVTFTPGPVMFNGQAVDFAGTEANWLASSYGGSVLFPVASGPATVNVTGTLSIAGAATYNTRWTEDNISIGAAFGSSMFDVAAIPSQPFGPKRGNAAVWTSPVVPQLNGANVTLTVHHALTSVDPVNGIVSATMSGVIGALGDHGVPTLGEWGLIVLALGFLGIGGVIIHSRRSAESSASPAI